MEKFNNIRQQFLSKNIAIFHNILFYMILTVL